MRLLSGLRLRRPRCPLCNARVADVDGHRALYHTPQELAQFEEARR